MKHSLGDDTIFFSHVKKNILRCTITKREEPVNRSWLVRPDIFSSLYDDGDPQADGTVTGEEIVFSRQEGELLRLKSHNLTEKDVIRYSTLGETPQVEVVKTVDGQRTRISNLKPYTERRAFEASVSFAIPSETGIFGLGQDEDGVFNRRGTRYYLYQHNMRIPMPFLMTDAGYGMLFDCASLMIFDDTGETTDILLDTVDQIDFYLITGDMDNVVSGFRYLTGQAALLPKWAFGYIQSQERYKSQFEIVDKAKRYRELSVPLDMIVQDWKTWPGEQWGQKTVDKGRYPDIAAMNNELHDMNVHSMISVWPNMAAGCDDHAELFEAGHLLGDHSTYNAFDKDARDIYWKQAQKELYTGGFDSWWCDSTEPFTAPDWCGERRLPEQTRYELVGGEHKKYLDPAAANMYAVMHAQGIYENQLNVNKDKRVFNLSRSGYPGIQKYGVALWAGDTAAKWDELKKEIAKGLNVGMSGIPFWTVDIGAFFTGGTACWRKWSGNENAAPVWFWNGDYDNGAKDPAYRELYTRWLQFGAFLPLFRSHGTDTNREIWNFGKPGDMFYNAIEKFIKLRYRLMPYIYSAAMRVALQDGTIMRSLMFDFPNDRKAKQIDDQYMFGDALLICPVTHPMYYDRGGVLCEEKKRVCYLPEGPGWYDFWTDDYYHGGQTVYAEAQIDILPVFVKAGSLVFMQKQTQHALEKTDSLEVWIYKGADAKGYYFDDDGISYDYQNGQYEYLQFGWNDDARQLTIHECSRYRTAPLMLNIHCGDIDKTIVYDGGVMLVDVADCEKKAVSGC